MKKPFLLFLMVFAFCIGILAPSASAATAKLSMPATPFNRLTIRYSAPTPVKLTVSYKEGNTVQTDVFYLEAGENAEFSALNQSYLCGKTAKNLKIISAQSLTNGEPPVIHAVTGEKIPVYATNVLYLEDTRYKVGVNLTWGGGISEIYDKNNPVEGLTNLINNHDTGRNIQQSYYGTEGNKHYKAGLYNGTPWPYNPVQGGANYNVPSRLIDVVVREKSVTIKSQPADWALKDSLTPSYMENTFTLLGDCIRVDNRFVDFSGLSHPERTQEVPAIYVVNWLDAFVWYAGDKSWTGDALSWDTNLPGFETGETEQMRKRLWNGQNEDWCAWVNQKDDYGLGLYVPGADFFLAKRGTAAFTKDAGANETNYIAPIDSMKIVSYEPIAYSYLLTTGSVASIRSTFEKNRDFAVNEMLNRSSRLRIFVADYSSLDFSVPQSADVFKNPVYDATAVYDESQKAVCLTATTGNDPYLTLDYSHSTPSLSADRYKTLRLTYMVPKTNARTQYNGELFLCAGAYTDTAAGISKPIPKIIADGQWHTIDINLSASFWKGDIHAIRFDFFNDSAAGDQMYVREMTLLPVVDYTALDFTALKSSTVFTDPCHDATAAYDKSRGAVCLTSKSGNDPYLTLNYDTSAVKLSADTCKTLRLTYMVPQTNSRRQYSGELFLCAGKQTETKAGISKSIPKILADGQWHTVDIDLTADFWKGDIHAIRFDFFNECKAGDVMYVQGLTLVPQKEMRSVNASDVLCG